MVMKDMNTILGPDSEIGEEIPSKSGRGASYPIIRVAGSLHISCDVRANVSAEGSIVIAAASRVRGSVGAYGKGGIIIGGIVQGNVVANDGVTLLSTAVVIGDIQVGKKCALRIDEGAVLVGQIIVSSSTSSET